MLERPLMMFVRHIVTLGYRSLAHTPWFWLLLSLPVLWLAVSPFGVEPAYLIFIWFGVGFVVSAWQHLIIDAMSTGGIPLLKPNGRRIGVRLYDNGALTELMIIGPVLGLHCAIALMVKHPYTI